MSETPVSPVQKLHVNKNPLAAYAELPKGTCYQDQQPNEIVEILLRRHIITNIGWIIITIIGLAIPTLISLIDPLFLPGGQWLRNIPQPDLDLATWFWYLLVVGFAVESFLDWYYNVYLVTSERLVDVDFIGLMNYAATEAALHQIQDVEHKQQGLWELLFNYGTVEVQTAGTRQNIVFEKIPQPSKVADIITDLLPREEDIRESAEHLAAPTQPSSASSPSQPGDQPTEEKQSP